MELALSSADLAFRDDVRAFLAEQLTPELRETAARLAGTFCDAATMARWHEILFRKGWVAPAWPREYGGADFSDVQLYIFASECARAGTPPHFSFGTLMCGPVLMRYGSDAQKHYYLPRILSGEHRWCQGFSEPGSGSDLASLRTRAVADAEDYVVSGTKVWTTFAHDANWMFCLVRTAEDVKPQRGISFLLVDMTSPGITVRPIINIAGQHEFNQVFLDGVRVPKSNLVGVAGDGWLVAKCLLEFERGVAFAAGLLARLAQTEGLARRCGGLDESFRARLAEAEIEVRALEMLERRVMSARSLGQSLGPAASLIKLRGSELTQHVDELALEALGLYAVVSQPDAIRPGNNACVIGPAEGLAVTPRYLYDRAITIFGGTSEVQRNILARAALGL
jgi:alkylation response protein AidB-like acyl-CoA dehydrogenase